MEIFNNYYAKKQFQKDVHCAKNIWVTFQYFDVFLYKTLYLIFGPGFDFGSYNCASKGK